MKTMRTTATKSRNPSREPRKVWSVTVADLGAPGLALRAPLTVMIEDHDDDFTATWPEVEAWGEGRTEADAINSLKDELVALYDDLKSTPDTQLGKLPRRWKHSLSAMVVDWGLEHR